MRKISKLVKISITTILTLSMILGSYMGVFAVPAANGIGKYVTEVVQEEEWGYVQANKGEYVYISITDTYIKYKKWMGDVPRYDYVKVQDEVTQQVWESGSIVISPNSLNLDYNKTDKIDVTISNSNYDFDDDNGTTVWSTSDSSIVRINTTSENTNGKKSTAHIKAVGIGTATVTLVTTINGVTYTKSCQITVTKEISWIGVNTSGKISYVAQETYNGNINQATAQLANASISNINIKLGGLDQILWWDFDSSWWARVNVWHDFKLSTISNYTSNSSLVISYTISGTASNGDAISENVVDTISYEEAVAAWENSSDKSNILFTFVYNYLVNTNYYDVTFSDKGTDTLVSKVVENGNVLSSQIPSASTYEETAIDGTKTVHTFNGWLLNNVGDALSNAEVATTDITSNTTFVASYTDVNYNTVLFNDGDGSAIGSVLEVEQGLTVDSVPAEADKSDKYEDGVKTTYVFNGNWEDEDGNVYTSEEVAALSITENKTFTALFDETNHFTVIFEDEASNELDRVEYVTNGNAVDSSLIPVILDTNISDGSGKRTTTEFEGWLDADTNATVDLSTEIITSNRTFVADITTTNFFTIELYDQDGNFITSIEVQEGQDVTDIPEAPLKADELRADGKYYFTFDKWILMPDLEAMTFEASNEVAVVLDSVFTGVQGPMKLIPIYTENKYIEVKFYVQLTDGTKVLAATQYVKPGEDAVDPAADLMKANGYTLGAWNGSITGVEKDTEVTARVASVAGAVETGTGTNTRQPVIAGATEVATGDNTPIVSMSVLLMAAAFSIVFITKKRRKDA